MDRHENFGGGGGGGGGGAHYQVSYRAFSMTSKVRIAQARRKFTAAILVYSLPIEMYGATEDS